MRDVVDALNDVVNSSLRRVFGAQGSIRNSIYRIDLKINIDISVEKK